MTGQRDHDTSSVLPGQFNRLDEETLIPELLMSAPHLRPVLDRYGLRGCGGRLGPYETLGFFARAHEVPIDDLLAELRSELSAGTPGAVAAGASSVPVASARPLARVLDNPKTQLGDAIYRPFFKAGIAVVLSLGGVWGAYLLIRIAISGNFAAAGLQEVNAHGHAQIFGWVGLFVMGFAYQAFPRFKHTSLAWPRLAYATLGMMLVGVVVHSLAQPFATVYLTAWWAAVLAAAVEVGAICLFVTNIVATWRKSGKPLAFYDYYIIAALGWFVLQAVYASVYLAATLSASGEALVWLVSTWQAPLRDIQIHGFAMMMILGVSQRIFHHFYGLPKPSERLSAALLVVLNVAIIGEVCGLILMHVAGPAWAAIWYGSVVSLAVAVAALVWNWRIFSKPQDNDRSLKFLRAAYIWLLLSLVMLVSLPIYQHGLLAILAPESGAAQLGFSHAFYGAIRHAITVGFISMMIVGVASKVVPTLNGIPSGRLSALWAPFILINLGCTLRVFGQTLTDFTAGAFPIAGVSGLLEVAGLALWGGHLWLIMSGRARLRPEAGNGEPASANVLDDGEPIRGSHTVGAVLEARPELLDVFTSHGFAMLANPQLRRTIARVVTVEKACRRIGIDLDAFLQVLNATSREGGDCHHSHGSDDGSPPACGRVENRSVSQEPQVIVRTER